MQDDLQREHFFAFVLNALGLIAVCLYCFNFSPSLSTLWLWKAYATEHISIRAYLSWDQKNTFYC